ncbi:MAG: Maf family nucleotide pyrophosphatase [Ginsengibacter sp.]
MDKIILASGSPRRKLLLEWAEIQFDVVVSSIEESYPANLPPQEIAEHIASNKANAVRNQLATNNNHYTILAADTVVVLEQNIIGKPTDREDAVSILKSLSGKFHDVITGVCILSAGKEISFSEKTIVQFHELSLAQIQYYVDHYKPYDKAGAYAIQEWIGVVGVKSINGDFYNVMGLPVSRVVKELTILALSKPADN